MPTLMALNLAIYINKPTLVAKISVAQKIYKTDRYPLKLSTFTVTYPRTHSFHKAFQLTVINNQTKFGCKRVSSSEDIIETVIF